MHLSHTAANIIWKKFKCFASSCLKYSIKLFFQKLTLTHLAKVYPLVQVTCKYHYSIKLTVLQNITRLFVFRQWCDMAWNSVILKLVSVRFSYKFSIQLCLNTKVHEISCNSMSHHSVDVFYFGCSKDYCRN